MGDRAAQAGETFWSHPGGDEEAYNGDFEESAAVASIMLLLLGKNCYYQARSVGTLGAEMAKVRASWSACPSPQSSAFTRPRFFYGETHAWRIPTYEDETGTYYTWRRIFP